ncbi:MAG: thioredoxin family protein [Alphaproteobacteria bacterium]|nr:thioredoxin family protein [Alphaproteobacteria bacterium]MDA8003666.1 thioredoxin family protein [Alphaproteobacteria bacterium]MDA8005427.1 thioredoxin family protein [Alphaproteobacteria bacterium]MDA8012550.1 thioredoxin family protein [Alphaproteobacteria bacterium]
MALEQTPICDFGAKAPDFTLAATDGKRYSLADIRGENGTLIMFICNHCPYVKAIASRLAPTAARLLEAGVGVGAVMPNDTEAYPDDSFAHMRLFAERHGFGFPYMIDETQDIARAYGAVCTPDFFGYDAGGGLQYRGRLDATTPSQPAAGDARQDLLEAMLGVAKGGKGPSEQQPSRGCSIKWRE